MDLQRPFGESVYGQIIVPVTQGILHHLASLYDEIQ